MNGGLKSPKRAIGDRFASVGVKPGPEAKVVETSGLGASMATGLALLSMGSCTSAKWFLTLNRIAVAAMCLFGR